MTFSLRTTHNGRHHWLTPGDKIDLEFDDGKGVSGRLADVNVEPGGSAFSLIVTHDGRPLVREPFKLSDLGTSMHEMTEATTTQGDRDADARPETVADNMRNTLPDRDLRATRTSVLELLRAKERELLDLARQLADARSAGHSFQRQLRRAQEAVNVKAADVVALRAEVQERGSQLGRYRVTITELGQKVLAKDEKLRETERFLEGRNDVVEELRASLTDLGNDYRLVSEQLEQLRGTNEAQASEIRRLRTELRARHEKAQTRTTLEEKFAQASQSVKAWALPDPPQVHITNFYGEPSTEQVLAARERPRQRVVTQHDEDGSVTIRVELREGN